MSGTSASLGGSGGGGAGLPTPKVQLYVPNNPAGLFVAKDGSSSGGTTSVVAKRYVKVTVPGIPSSILENAADYQPMVELLRFVPKKARENASTGNGNKAAGFVHPSSAAAVSGNGSFTHGGGHGGTSSALQALRVTEWAITNGNDAIDVTQGILAFMSNTDVSYRDAGGTSATIRVTTAESCFKTSWYNIGSRFPYSRRFGPGRFIFRLSVRDLNDARQKRIHGPNSAIVLCSNNVFPFNPAGVDANGRAQATVSGFFDDKQVSFWFEQRIPAN